MKNTHLTNERAIWAGIAIFAVALVVILFLVNFDVYFLMVVPLLIIIGVPGSVAGALVGSLDYLLLPFNLTMILLKERL